MPDDLAPEMREWIDRFAAALGVATPTDHEVGQLLELAAEAAHASVRQSAPVACWLAARAGVPLEDAIRLARPEIGG